jgi:hypothetical protein
VEDLKKKYKPVEAYVPQEVNTVVEEQKESFIPQPPPKQPDHLNPEVDPYAAFLAVNGVDDLV